MSCLSTLLLESSILILFSHLRIRHSSEPFPSVLPTKRLYVPLLRPIHARGSIKVRVRAEVFGSIERYYAEGLLEPRLT